RNGHSNFHSSGLYQIDNKLMKLHHALRLSHVAQVSNLPTPHALRRAADLEVGNTTRLRASRQSAFTLIELLLVLVILGILAAIVVPKFAGRTEQAKLAAAQSQISTFGTALDAFEVDNGYYPRGKNGLADLIQPPRDAQGWKGPYMKSDNIPMDPWGHPYIYE